MTPETFEQLIGQLNEQLGETYVITDEDARHAYAQDETGQQTCLPDLVVKPANAEEVGGILRTCNQLRVPVVPRGGGSGVSGGALAIHGGVILCLERLNRVMDIDPSNMTVTCETGVITGELQAQLLERGLFLPPDPGSKDWCQIGGNLAEMAAGPKSVKYGAFRDYVLDLQVVLASGEIIRTGAPVRKMACGYNLTQLMLGSEGTLGIITQVTFKVIPGQKEHILLRFAFPTLEAAGAMICQTFEKGLVPCELEFMDRDALQITAKHVSEDLDPEIAAMLWIGFDGNDSEHLMEAAEAAGDLAESLDALDALVAETPDQERNLWSFRHSVGEAVIERTSFRDVDVCFPRSELAHVVSFVKSLGKEIGFNSVCFGHSGDGNLHIQVLREDISDEHWNGPVAKGIRRIYEEVVQKGGALSGEHGIGSILTQEMSLMFTPPQLALMGAIKDAFDPNGILNPGKILPRDSLEP